MWINLFKILYKFLICIERGRIFLEIFVDNDENFDQQWTNIDKQLKTPEKQQISYVCMFNDLKKT